MEAYLLICIILCLCLFGISSCVYMGVDLAWIKDIPGYLLARVKSMQRLHDVLRYK